MAVRRARLLVELGLRAMHRARVCGLCAASGVRRRDTPACYVPPRAHFRAAQVMWESPADWVEKFFTEELEAHVPREILSCKEVSREVNFSSVEKMVPDPPPEQM